MDLTLYSPNSPILGYIFDYPIRYYGVIMSFSFLLGVFLIYQIFKNKLSKKDAEIFLDYSPLIIFFSIIGARVFYVLGDFEYYKLAPKEMFFINHGGLSIFGAIFFGFIALIIFSKIKKFNFWKHCDVIAIVFPLCQAFGRFGNYFNQEAYGRPYEGILKLYIGEQHRLSNLKDVSYYHPTFLYEAILDFLLFTFLLFLFSKNKKLKDGNITCLYLIFYSVIRFFIERIRIDSILNVAQVPIAQIIALLIFTISTIALIFLNKKHA